MRSFIKSSVLVLTLAIAGSAAIIAQAPQDQSQGPRPHGQWQGCGQNPQFEIKMLTKRLSLSPEQAAQIEPILVDRQTQFAALKPAPGTTPDYKALHQSRKTIMEDTQAKINALLTPDQIAKLHEHHGQRGNWKPQGGPTPSA